MSSLVTLLFTICLSDGSQCEDHSLPMPMATPMICMIVGQAEIAKNYPLRKGQIVEKWKCVQDG